MDGNIIVEFIAELLQDRRLQGNSSKWANWMSELALNTCITCRDNHGKIVDIALLSGKTKKYINAHLRCVCKYVAMRTKSAGTATNMGYSGADASLFYLKRLPDYYITKENAVKYGWKNKKGNLDEVLPGKMIGGELYNNKEKKLPDAFGRQWYEADINYDGGYRNRQRVLYSNDGLIFVTYDHYQTFYEIVK